MDRIYNGPCNGDGHGNGYDHDCCGSTTAAITTLAMVTIAAAMATIAEPMSVLDRPPPPTANFINGGVLLSMLAVIVSPYCCWCDC